MIEIMIDLACILVIAIVVGAYFTLFFILYGLSVCFWKIHIKKKQLLKEFYDECQHDNLVYTDVHPEKHFKCTDCGELF
ncbi:hypothetical protein [Flavobacterium aquiphilum]|uniref:hypothetical protein n=1 Tax=Flavobacterium aquiphilum TaxID=3003261 RepID=UPI00247FA1AC|nr:hypothetical protein [Flavobacterium aquiphilum]